MFPKRLYLGDSGLLLISVNVFQLQLSGINYSSKVKVSN